MRQLRAIMMVILGTGVLTFSILAAERAFAQEGARAFPRVVAQARPAVGGAFDVDWHQAPGSPSVLGGCVYNRYGAVAEKVRVGVEGLDTKGAVVANTATWVGDVPAESYGHFEFPVLAGAANYRIKMLAYERSQAR